MTAAAKEFDRHGFNGASLNNISNSTGVSMGALTFHFRAKELLVDAVHERAASLMREAVERAVEEDGAPLHRARNVLLAVANLLKKESAVRAAARLSRERKGKGDEWIKTWLPALRDQLQLAAALGDLDTDADVETIAALVTSLLAGLEISLRTPKGMPGPLRSPEHLWDLIRPALTARQVPVRVT
ncbi:TetR family transcriptional regulator [Streptomyces sp. NPDC059740]|uniref:TetR family transcriptional regulator n=1 Tax=Streptomyces sp. NPDC059740 TaxID=3346926 RepID=UPI003646228B